MSRRSPRHFLLLATSVFVACYLAACSAAPSDVVRAPAGPGDAVSLDPSLDDLDRGTVTLRRAGPGDDVDVAVALPETDEQFRRGLMEVPELADGTGMLFDFGRERTGGFWMKDTLVPLDIAFASDDGEVLVVLAMAPCRADPCPVHDPGVSYRFALEVPRGWFAANDLGAGDRLELAAPG